MGVGGSMSQLAVWQTCWERRQMQAPMQRETKGKWYLDAVPKLGEAVAEGGRGYAREEDKSKKRPCGTQAWLHFGESRGRVVAMLVRGVWGTVLMLTTRRYDADVAECIDRYLGTCMAVFTSGQRRIQHHYIMPGGGTVPCFHNRI
jgi:hypothetical protein